ncbi:MAG: hypothetical protein HWE23_04950 [Rhodobacteraceae bacterium]|nr:hypothetical protein [Paracoccaceae bacterium]
MTKFAFIYTGGNPPASKEEGMAHMARWQEWAQGLGTAYVFPGMPFSNLTAVSSTGVRNDLESPKLAGVSVVEAASMEEAQKMAASCPHLNLGGEIIVAEGMDMPM